MTQADNQLFGSTALLTKCVRPAQLEECLRQQRSESPRRAIGEILLEKGYITPEQLNMVLEARRKRGRKHGTTPDEQASAEKAFGHLAISESYVTIDDLEAAVLEQQRLRGLNLHFCLGEIFVASGRMKPADVLEVLSLQGRRILVCPLCDLHYNIIKFQKAKEYACPGCGAVLIQPKFLESVAVDGVIQE